MWTDGEAGHDALSEESTSCDEDDEDSETIAKTSSENGYVDDCGPIGEKYIVCLNEVEQSLSRTSKQKVLQAAMEYVN